MSTWTAAKRARYGGTHRAERKRWAPLVAAGVAPRDPILEQFRPQGVAGAARSAVRRPEQRILKGPGKWPASCSLKRDGSGGPARRSSLLVLLLEAGVGPDREAVAGPDSRLDSCAQGETIALRPRRSRRECGPPYDFHTGPWSI
jgi:hypothetical protein